MSSTKSLVKKKEKAFSQDSYSQLQHTLKFRLSYIAVFLNLEPNTAEFDHILESYYSLLLLLLLLKEKHHLQNWKGTGHIMRLNFALD